MGTSGRDREEFCLRWNDFESQTTSAFRNLRNDAEFSDIRLAVKGEIKPLKAHRVVLSACSPYFHDLFREMNSEQNGMLASPSYIMMSGVNSDYLSAILDFMYVGEAKVAEKDLEPFLKLAEELQVEGLVSKDESKSEEGVTPKKHHAQPIAAQPCLSNPSASKRARMFKPPTPTTQKASRKRQMKMEVHDLTNNEIYDSLKQNLKNMEESSNGTSEEVLEIQDDESEASRDSGTSVSCIQDGSLDDKEMQENGHFLDQNFQSALPHLTQQEVVCEICHKVYKNKKSKDSHVHKIHKKRGGA